MTENEKPLVKYDGKWWVLYSVKDGMATIWTNGQPALVPEELLQYEKGHKKGE